MTPDQQRDLVNDAEALARLTDHQRMVVELVRTPTADGKRRSIAGIAKGLKCSRVAIYKTLKAAGFNMQLG